MAGLLAMHGFEGAAITLTDPGFSAPHHEHSPNLHGALGMCVFLASVAGLGLAAAKTRPRCRYPRASSLAGSSTVSRVWITRRGRPLLLGLQVLRL